MSGELIVHRNRTNVVPLSLGMDVSGDTITSQIRAEDRIDATLLCTWVVTFKTDGTDGEIILTLPVSAVGAVTKNYGYMDLKRVSGGEPLSVFRDSLKVKFQGVVTS